MQAVATRCEMLDLPERLTQADFVRAVFAMAARGYTPDELRMYAGTVIDGERVQPGDQWLGVRAV